MSITTDTHDELGCLTRAVAMYQTILDQADGIAVRRTSDHYTPEDELRAEMPAMIACLSPQARALLADYLSHVGDLVAFMHRVTV